MEQKTIKRDIAIDLMKFIAIIGVVFIHSCSFSAPIASSDWCMALFYRSLFSASVPLFLMSSGALMLDSQKEVPLKKLYFKNILRLFIAMIFWGVMYKLYHLYDENLLSLYTFGEGIREVFLFSQEFHFYYIHMMFIVYAFLPVTKTFVNSASQKNILYFLILWFVFGILYPTLTGTPFLNSFSGMVTQYGINMTYASIGYGVLGYYLKKYPLKRLYSLILVLLGFTLVFGLTLIKSTEYGVLYERYLEGTGIYVCILAVGAFSLIYGAKLKSGCGTRFVTWVSNASFGIYLVHMLVMHMVKDAGINIDFSNYGVSIPLFALLILVISSVIYFILSKIPLIRKWIV